MPVVIIARGRLVMDHVVNHTRSKLSKRFHICPCATSQPVPLVVLSLRTTATCFYGVQAILENS